MLRKDDNLDAEFNRYLLKQFFSAYKTKQQYYWSEDEFECIIKFCLNNNKLSMMHYALSLALKYYPHNVEFHYYSGKYFMLTNKYTKAITHFKKFLLDDAENDFVVFEMCFCWEMLEEEDQAIEVFTDYLDKVNSNSSAGWFALGTVYIKKDEIDNAIDAFELSLALNPESIATYFNLGNLYCIKGAYDKAYLIYLEVLKYDEEDAAVYANLGECCFYLEDYENVIEYEKKALSLNNNYEYAYYFLAKTYFKYSNYNLAADFVQKAIDCDDKISEFYSLKAYISLNLDNTQLAEESFKTAVKLDPTLFECHLEIAVFYLQENRINDVIGILEENLPDMSGEDKMQAEYLLCACYYYTGNKQESYALFINVENSDAALFDFLYDHFENFVNDPVISDLIANMNS
ncbi:MAG: hypothetical protein LBP67_03475 [Bacteroidales bacterium]|jgi:tetratricopeptide (TPR) repeat protein|nr:hypothetical protein [Bacteroidales bacterium]